MTDTSARARLRGFPPPETRFVRFAAAGALGTACHYLVLVALTMGAGTSPAAAAASGALVGALVNYWLNHRFIFRSQRRHAEALPRFAAMALFGAGLNGLIVGALARLGVYFLLAQLCATLLILALNYLVSKRWIFQSRN